MLANQKIGLHLAFPFHIQGPTLLKVVALPQTLLCRRADVDSAGLPERLHPAGDVDRVAPQVVRELLLTDHAGDCRATADADPELVGLAMPRAECGDRILHRQRHIGDRVGVAKRWPWQPTR